MNNYYLAVDLGASSGRVIGGYIEDGRLILEELHRFENGMTRVDGSLCWDYNHIFSEILKGLKICASRKEKPVSLGIDTWGVDYVLLDPDGLVLGKTYAYRDDRLAGMDKRVDEIISPGELYARTGLQKASFNTIYQLTADKAYRPDQLMAASSHGSFHDAAAENREGSVGPGSDPHARSPGRHLPSARTAGHLRRTTEGRSGERNRFSAEGGHGCFP